jgi:hypothetical protein
MTKTIKLEWIFSFKNLFAFLIQYIVLMMSGRKRALELFGALTGEAGVFSTWKCRKCGNSSHIVYNLKDARH